MQFSCITRCHVLTFHFDIKLIHMYYFFNRCMTLLGMFIFLSLLLTTGYNCSFKNPSLSLYLVLWKLTSYPLLRWWRPWVVYFMEDGPVGPSSQQWACVQNDSAAYHFGRSRTWGWKGRWSIQQSVHSTSPFPNWCKFWVNQIIFSLINHFEPIYLP